MSIHHWRATRGQTVWECKYHVVWVPKYRRKVLYGEIRRYLGEVIRDLAAQKECRVEEGHLRSDHVHMLISIPPKHSVAQAGRGVDPTQGSRIAATTAAE